MSLDQAWDFQHPSLGAGYFLFTNGDSNVQSMSSDEISAFAARLHSLLPRVVRDQHASLGWINGSPLSPSSIRVQTLSMVRVGGVARTQNIPQAIRFQQYEVMVLPATPFERTSSGFVLRNTEYMAPPGADPRTDQPTNRRIYFRGAAAHDIDKVGDSVNIPLMGDGRGSLQFSLNGIAGIDIDPGILDVAMYYVVPDPERGRDQSLRYPLLNLTSPSGGGATSEINFQARLYPSNPLQSMFDFGNSDTADGPIVQSYFATYHGYPVHLIPQAGAGLMFTHVPNPGVYPSRAAEVRTHFGLIPVGTFEMTVSNPTMEVEWLRGGSSGSEFISFQPKGPAGRGDVLVFFRNQNGYAPDFDQLAIRLQQVPEDKLTNRYTTSWATVGHHPLVGQNGHLIQYYAQPDDNVLHTSVNGNAFLDPLEVAAADLQTLGHSGADEWVAFPITPLNGVVAPDPRISPTVGMDKYVIFEKEIMSPIRKSRISKIKPNSIATGSGRSLFQAGVVNATTPQGMLVEVADTDWQKLTMAYDGIQNLSFGDITDEFQDALQTNLLFMVASKAGVLDQGTTDDKVEITGWPFRLEVGQSPLGMTPAASGLHRYNNVVIFKFIDESFDEMLDDTTRWATPDEFNNDTADIAAWLKEVIADAREKATQPATKDLYEPLVNGVLNNANWSGVIALNVTIPLGEMPCEVKGLLGGIKDWSTFKAHHLGFEISKVNPSGTSIEKSSIFGLLDYTDPGTPTEGDPTYDFRVNSLQVRFANTEIADFDAEVAVVMNTLFDEAVDTVNGTNTLKLKGTYEDKDGKPTYSFGSSTSTPFKLKSTGSGLSLIDTVTFTKCQFATGSCPVDLSEPVLSRFSFWGSFTFRLNANFDFFSFDKLEFADLALTMAFAFDSEGIPDMPATYAFLPGDVRFNVAASRTRQDSLLGNFPLRLKGFHYAGDGLNVSKMGYLDIPGLIPGWSGASTPKYALDFTLDMGPLASSSSKKVPTGAIDMIAAWEPSSEGGGVTFGVALGRNKDGKMEIGIEGVFVLSIQSFGFQKLPPPDGEEGHVYAFFLKSAFIKVLNTQIPPGGTISLVLFVPYTGGDKPNLKNLGWFVAYKSGTGGSGASPAAPSQFDVEITETSLSVSEVEPNSTTPVVITVKVRNKNVPPKEPEEITVSVKAVAVEPTDTRPLPPGPPQSKKVTVATGQTSDAITFNWPPKMAGKYKFTATAMIKGDLNPGDNTRDSAVLTVKENPGKKDEKTTILQLDYLGLGQRVKIPGLTPAALAGLTSVEAVIKEMDAKVVPNAPAPEGSDPTASNAALAKILGDVYSPDGGWLIGFDVTLFEVVRLAVVFAQDNNMYGALIGFAKKAPSFIKGFQIQILYKKISDEIGVYHILLTLPDSLRQFNVGAAAITLPTIGLDIYTNGDFKIDLGFPHNADFSKSFGIQAMAGPVPIIGYAGFYFAKLSGPTSSKAPKLKPYDASVVGSGKFDPVLEFGLGLSLGIGKTFEKGPLRAGVSVSIVVILEGAVGYYQEAGATQAASTAPVFTQEPDWYLVKGQAGLQAVLFGVVDFGIIKAGIEVTATALFTFTVEAYKNIVLGLSLNVSVKVTVVIGSIKIFGKRIQIKISFSFSATFSFDFTVKNPKVGQEPWKNNLATSATIGSSALMQSSSGPAEAVSWSSLTIFGSKQALALTFAPQVTIAGTPSTPRVVAGLTINHGNDNLAGFDPLIESLIRWAVSLDKGSTTAADSTVVTVGDLLYLEQRLNVPDSLSRPVGSADPLDYATIRDFLKANFDITINPLASEADGEPTEVSGIVFPIVPELELSVSGDNVLGTFVRDLAEHNKKNFAYQDDVRDYFDSLLVDVEHKSGILANSNRILQQADTPISMSTIVFQDYFAFLVKTGIDRAAQYLLDASGPEGSTTLGALVSGMRDSGAFRSIASMASRFFLHGLRLPDTFTTNGFVADSANALALYELTGQQVEVALIPQGEPEDEDDPPPPFEKWELDLLIGSAGGTDPLLTLTGDLKFVIDREDEDSAAAFNEVAAAQISLGTVMVNRLPSIADQPKRYTFKSSTPLEMSPIDTPTAAGHLYPLPDTLLSLFGESGAPGDLTPFNAGDGVSDPANFTKRPALRVDFTAKRVPRSVEGSTDLLPNVYQIGGMSEGARSLVGKLIAYIGVNGPGIVHDLRIYYEVFGKSDAIVRDNLGSDPDVVLMKTNLSTVSAPQDGASLLAHHPAADDYSAAMITSQIADFLRLLWEASIVNAPGYYLYYDNGVDGDSGLPEDIFGGMSNEGRVSLVVTFTGFNSFANTYLIDGPDFVEGDFYLESQSQRKWAPALAPGAIAFELTRPNPNHDDFAGASGSLGLESLFNLLSYQVLDNASFRPSIRGLPVGPSDPNGNPDVDPETLPESVNWIYRQGIRVYPFAKAIPEGSHANTYAGTGGAISVSFDFLDVYGNEVTATDAGSLPALTNEPIRYYDPLMGVGQWPSVSSNFLFTAGGDLVVTLKFDTTEYDLPEDAERRASALEGFLRVNEQLNGPGVSAMLWTSLVLESRAVNVVGGLTAFVDQVLDFLKVPEIGKPPIVTTVRLDDISQPDRDAITDNIFPITVEIAIVREWDLVDDQARTNLPESHRSATTISPQSVAGGGNDVPPENQPMALETFANDFETAFPEFKVATGLGAQGANTVWVVRLGQQTPGGRGITYHINGSQPAFFAPAPLSNTLLARDDVAIYATDGISNPTAESFTEIDMDKWGREFVDAVDRFLTADIAVTARKINSEAYKRIISAKSTLADGISAGVTNVLAQGTVNGSYLSSARETYKQALLTRLSSAYEIETAVVYPVGTSNSDPETIAPRLFGNIKGDPKIQDGAEFSFSTAKVELSGGENANFAFLFDAKRTEDQASALVDITYRITHVEHDIQTALNGYEASSWLTLVKPIVNATFVNVDIPIALREYPMPPSLVGQQAIPEDLEGATTLERATLWQYLYTYEQRSVAQDTIFTNVKFNVGDAVPNSFLLQTDPDLFDWLARFSREYPVLLTDLDRVLVGFNTMSAEDRTAASNAINWLATLVEGVAATWEPWVSELAGMRQLQQSSLGAYEWDFDLTERLFGNEAIIEMRTTPDSHPSAKFPMIDVTGETGDVLRLSPSISGGVASYSYNWISSELPEFLDRTQVFNELDVLHTENAWGGIHLERNLNLSAPGTTRTTNPLFVYQTPEIRFVNKVTPLIDNKQPIEVARGQTRDLAGHIGAMFNELFGSAVNESTPRERLIKIGVRYAYDVRGQGGPALGPAQTDEFQAYMPVLQVMPKEVQPNNLGGFRDDLAASINGWLSTTNPIRNRGFLEFDISVFAALSETDLPVLRLRRLWLGLDRIS